MTPQPDKGKPQSLPMQVLNSLNANLSSNGSNNETDGTTSADNFVPPTDFLLFYHDSVTRSEARAITHLT